MQSSVCLSWRRWKSHNPLYMLHPKTFLHSLSCLQYYRLQLKHFFLLFVLFISWIGTVWKDVTFTSLHYHTVNLRWNAKLLQLSKWKSSGILQKETSTQYIYTDAAFFIVMHHLRQRVLDPESEIFPSSIRSQSTQYIHSKAQTLLCTFFVNWNIVCNIQ